MILSTGEDVPRGQSLRARLLVVEMSPGDLDWQRLSSAQQEAAAGTYASAVAGYLRWLAPRIGDIRRDLPEEAAAVRARVAIEGHARTPGIIADLYLGLRRLGRFAVSCGAISEKDRRKLLRRSRQALLAAAAEQAAHIQAAEPCAHFLRLLAAALSSGRAHVTTAEGDQPDDPLRWGWIWDGDRRKPQGRHIGWLPRTSDEADTVGGLYLEPEASYAAAQELARDQGEALTVASRTLWRRLAEQKYLVSMSTHGATLR
jgi:hypothetical protein